MDLAEALRLGRELLRQHGLEGWTMTLDGAKTRAGACLAQRRQISLSRHLTRLHSQEEVRDTILHEVAHALVGPRHGHDAVWREAALRIGCSGQRCVPEDAPRVEGPWRGVCSAGHEVTRHRVPTRVSVCARCRGPETDRLLEWTHLGRRVPMHPNYVAELEAWRAGRLRQAPGRLPVGQAVRITAPGEFEGLAGRVVKRGRTRYHVQLRAGLVTVPFAFVDTV